MIQRMNLKGLLIAMVLILVFLTLFAGGLSEESSDVNYARSETIYTSGTQWGPPSSWNPYVEWGYAMGTVGLCYETLFLSDPMTNEYIPRLAESG